MAEQLLPFLGRINLRDAYEFDQAAILVCLQHIVSNPGLYRVPAANVPNLVLIHQDIVRLRHPNGVRYSVPPPPQSINRRVNPDDPPVLSTLQLLRSRYGDIEYWALPDLLGLFLSSLGLAPLQAMKRNFYLPLTAVFGQWCTKLLSGFRRWWPRVFQCTWNENREYALGASRGGFAVEAGLGAWLAVIDRARYGIIRSPLLTLANWSQAWTPTIRARGRRDGTPFGRCGESYPFRRLLMPCRTSREAERIHGLALENRYIYHAPAYDDRLSGNIWRRVWDPCLNYQALRYYNLPRQRPQLRPIGR